MDEIGQNLLAKVHDEKLIDYFYLRQEPDQMVDTVEGLRFSRTNNHYDIPFNAAVKGYHGAVDDQGHQWIIKPLANEQEAWYHRVCQVVHYLDFEMRTLSAPTMVLEIDGHKFRGTKVVPNAIQISSYNYLEEPYKSVLVSDLVNRWMHFDEDRNPNNYMVTQNSKGFPLIVAIDFDKSDLESQEMKITGTDDKFGWIRHEKNRYLTLFKPENFSNLTIAIFEARLRRMTGIDLARLEKVCARLFQGYCADPAAKAALIAGNVARRREYIDGYFRTWFKEGAPDAQAKENEAYAGFGATFLKMYQDRK